MYTEEFIIALFIKVDDAMGDVPKHPQAALYPSELVTLALLYALRGGADDDLRHESPDCGGARGHPRSRTTLRQRWATRRLCRRRPARGIIGRAGTSPSQSRG